MILGNTLARNAPVQPVVHDLDEMIRNGWGIMVQRHQCTMPRRVVRLPGGIVVSQQPEPSGFLGIGPDLPGTPKDREKPCRRG